VSFEVRRGIEAIIKEQPGIERINEHRTMHLGPDDVLLNLSLDFASDLGADQLEAAIATMELEIKTRYPQVRRVFIEAQSWTAHRADRAQAGHADP
jgi:divalent metal cation (Fe/Co/Zn/Cd) transporter